MGNGNYYETLQLQRNADGAEIKKAYRRLALKYHPDRDPSEDARRAFLLIAEAYEVLSNHERKGLYDSYGDEGLSMTIKDGQGGIIGGFLPHKVDPLAVFDKFFGTSNPYSALIDSAATFVAEGAGPKAEVGAATVYILELTLEEVFTGVRKIVQHRKKVVRADGTTEVVEKSLVVDVPPAVPEGQRFIFDQKPGETSGGDILPVVVIAQQKAHATFSRIGSTFDISHVARVPLVRALCGTVLNITALDGRSLSIPVPEIIPCGATKTLEGVGLPRGDGTFGDLVIRFEHIFPKGISDAQKTLVRAALFLPSNLNPQQAAAVKAFTRAFHDPKLGWAHAYPN